MNRRVLIVDDHPVVRAGLEQALLKANFSICAVAASKNEAIAQIARTNPNLILLDLWLARVAPWGRRNNGCHAMGIPSTSKTVQ